jgi:hypothetical protein
MAPKPKTPKYRYWFYYYVTGDFGRDEGRGSGIHDMGTRVSSYGAAVELLNMVANKSITEQTDTPCVLRDFFPLET